MKTKISIMFFLVLITNALSQPQNPKPQTIPILQKWNGGSGFFTFSSSTELVFDVQNQDLKERIEQFADDIYTEFQYKNQIKATSDTKDEIYFFIDEKIQKNEEYHIQIHSDRIKISAKTNQGIFWATRTLLQMLHNNGNRLPIGEIIDYPDYSHRGFMLDVGRKFFSLEYLQNYIKLLSYYKMNEFQIHLNDNGFPVFFDNDWEKTYSAFRLESTTFPELTAKDGHYTKEEFRQLQKMGMKYGVNIIPEIDIPAHSLAFTHYKPEIGSDKYGRDHLDLYNPETYKFIDALYAEYISGDAPTFVAPDVHIGTDEYDKKESEKYREFTDRYLKYIQKLGKNVRMWGGLRWLKGSTPVHSENVIVNAWSKDWVNPFESIKDGFQLINSCDTWLYIVPAAGYYRDFLDEKWIYEQWVPEKINSKEMLDEGTKEVLGGMFAVWNDHVGNGISQQDVHHRTLPAIKVLAQKMWNKKPKIPYDIYKKLADNLNEAPQVNLSGRVKNNDGLVLLYPLHSEKENDLSKMGYDEIYRENLKINTKEKALIFTNKSFLQTPISDIGYDYKVSFDLKLFPATNEKAILFESSYSKVFLIKAKGGYKIGFSRDGYSYEFTTILKPSRWNKIQISGDYKSVTLKVNRKEEKLSEIEKEFRKDDGKTTKMYYQQTLVFPLKYIGNQSNGFDGMMKNLKVEKSNSDD